MTPSSARSNSLIAKGGCQKTKRPPNDQMVRSRRGHAELDIGLGRKSQALGQGECVEGSRLDVERVRRLNAALPSSDAI